MGPSSSHTDGHFRVHFQDWLPSTRCRTQPLPLPQRPVGLPLSISHNSVPPPGGRPPLRFLSIVQHNSLRSWDVFLSLFNSFATGNCPPDIVCLYDPPFWPSRLPSLQNYTSFALPGGAGKKPQVAFYVSHTCWLKSQFYLLYLIDQMWLPSMSSGLTCLGSRFLSFEF